MTRADKIRQALRGGASDSYESIGARFGVSGARVGQIARSVGIIRAPSRDRIDEWEELRILQMSRSGLYVAEIARQLGRTQNAIARVLKEHGRPTSMFTDAEILMRAIKLVRAGATYSEAARALGITRNQVAGAVYRRKKQA